MVFKEVLNKIFSSEKIRTDFIISVGPHCRPSFYLKENNLRICANPLDWMYNYSLEDTLNLFETGFKHFFTDAVENEAKKNEFRHVTDNITGMISMHNFSGEGTFHESQQKFIETSLRRFKRIDEYMKNADSIIFLASRDEPIEVFENFLIKMHKLYPKKLTFLNIRTKFFKSKKHIQINEFLDIKEFSFNDKHPKVKKDWIGNYIEWHKLMKKIELSGKLTPPNKSSAISK